MPVVEPHLITRAASRHSTVVAALVLQELDHIGHAWHQPLYRDLELIRDLAGKLSKTNATGLDLRQLALRVAELQQAVAAHMHREDELLFPWLRAGRLRELRAPVLGLRMEHQDFVEELDWLSTAIYAASGPIDREPDGPALVAATYRFDTQLRRHLDCEDRLVFARVLDEEPQDGLWPE
jgi:regulator of cell morphogenesis and NO signaling